MPSDDRLEEYKRKRDFRRTSEPSGADTGKAGTAEGSRRFVIQKHDARNLHYDFRLEIDGVLVSWAVPKGPSTDPREKRLAVPTEDHPLAYADFEGVIPEDEYGGGTVLIWDRGSYHGLARDGNGGKGGERPAALSKQIKNGHVTIWLDGRKLSGGYALIRTGRGKKERWLLIKMDDEKADARRNPTSTEPRSVKTGRTLDEIREEEAKEEEEEGE